MNGKNVETIINREEVFVLGGVVAGGGGEEADERGYVDGDCASFKSVKRALGGSLEKATENAP